MQDYNSYLTEQTNEASAHLDELSTLEMVTLINKADQSVALAVEKELPSISKAVDGIAERLKNGGRLFYVGAGTSGRLGIMDAAECPPTYGTDPELVQGIIAGGNNAVFRAQERGEDDAEAGVEALQEKHFCKKDVCFGISASGSAAFVTAAMSYARELGGMTVLLCCNPQCPNLSLADVAIVPEVGPEVVSGSTRMKAATAQKMVLTAVSTATMVKLGRVRGNKMVYMKASNIKLHARAVRMVCELTGVNAETAEIALAQCNYNVADAAKWLESHPQ